MLPTPERRSRPELLDLPAELYTPAELEGSLADLTVVNSWLGNRRTLLKHLACLARDAGKSFSVLDVATGSGDLPIALARWARRRGIAISITAVDINPTTVSVARRNTAAYPEISCQVADLFQLPFADGSFDFVLCSKTLHHFSNREAVEMVRRMIRVARRGYIIIDLRRSWIAYGLITLLTRLLTGNRLTRSDGPLSVLKAYTPQELDTIVASGGITGYRIVKEPFWLMVLAGRVI